MIKKQDIENREYYISGVLILLLLIFAFLWYSQLTETSDGLINFVSKTIKNMEKIFTEEVRQSGLINSQWNLFYRLEDQTSLLQNYTKEVTLEYKNKPHINLYSAEKQVDYRPRIMNSKIVFSKTSPHIASKIYFFMEIIKKLVKIFILLGVFYLLFFEFKKRKINIEYTIMALIGLILVVAIIILPFASISYDLMRTYQQVLVILSLPLIFGGLMIFKFAKKSIRIICILLIFIFYFLFFTGFVPQIIGGANAPFQLNNFGEGYDRGYIHKTETKSSDWLSENYNKYDFIYADKRASCKLWLSQKINGNKVIENVFPSTIDKKAYVYSSHTNMIEKKAFVIAWRGMINYNFPTEFLNKNKNKIYNDGGSEIFK